MEWVSLLSKTYLGLGIIIKFTNVENSMICQVSVVLMVKLQLFEQDFRSIFLRYLNLKSYINPTLLL